MKRNAILVIAAAAILGLAGCSHVPDAMNPVSWYRHVTGAPQESASEQGPSDQKLAQGGTAPRANPTSVAPPPSPPPAPTADQTSAPNLKQLADQAGQLLAGAEADEAASNPAGPGAAMRTLPPAPTPMEAATAPAVAPTPPKPPASSLEIAQIGFGSGSAVLSQARRATIAEIVTDFNEKGGRIRVVGHGGAAGKNAALSGPQLALHRAQAVEAALTAAGVPATSILVEAAPAPEQGRSDAARADVYLEN